MLYRNSQYPLSYWLTSVTHDLDFQLITYHLITTIYLLDLRKRKGRQEAGKFPDPHLMLYPVPIITLGNRTDSG